jgi:hypothetical protein
MVLSYQTRAKLYEVLKLNRDALMSNTHTEARAMLIAAKLILLEELINEDAAKAELPPETET